MYKSKRSALIAVSVLACLSVGIGCGDGTNKKQPARLNRTLPASNPNKPAAKPGSPTDAKAIDPKTGKPFAADKTIDPNWQKVKDMEASLIGGTKVLKEELLAGTYKFDNVFTSIQVQELTSEASAIQQNSLVTEGNDLSLGIPMNPIIAGKIENATDEGRKIDLPLQFTVTSGKWTPDLAQANPTLSILMTSPTGDIKIASNLQKSETGTDITSVLGTLVNGKLGKLVNGKAIEDKTYAITDSKGVDIYVSLYKIDAQTLRVFMTFGEKVKPNVANNTPDKNVSLDRNVFLTYKFTAAEAKTATLNGDVILTNPPQEQQQQPPATPPAAPPPTDDSTGQPTNL